MEQLTIGMGEVGKALQKILKCDGIDIYDNELGVYNIIHICFPYNKNFIKQVKAYQKQYLLPNGLTIIHSTVPIGTSKKLDAVHSPTRGIHPHLEEGIRTFVKFFGGKRASEAALIFKKYGISTFATSKSENTEAMKLWDTTQYGSAILLEKEIYEFCQKNKLDFPVVYSYANATYNAGYKALDHDEYKRYILKHVPGGIGGHCIVSNCKLFNSPTAKQILNYDKKNRPNVNRKS